MFVLRTEKGEVHVRACMCVCVYMWWEMAKELYMILRSVSLLLSLPRIFHHQ